MAMKVKPEELKQHDNYIIRVKASIPAYAGLQGREKFLADRRLGIGGSDVAAILGVHPHKTALEVWAEKTGKVEPKDLSNIEAVHFGNELEDVVAREYMRRTLREVRQVNKTMICKAQPWLVGNLDRRVVGLKRVLELKTADKMVVQYGKQWGKGNVYSIDDQGNVIAVILCDEVPDTYLLQCLHYMIVTGWKVADLAVLIGGNQYRDYTIKFNEQLASAVCQRLKDFWFNNVIADVAPEPQNTSDLDMLHAQDNGEVIEANNEVLELVERNKEVKQQMKSLQQELNSNSFEIKNYMGSNSVLTDSTGKKLCSWKYQTAKRIDTTAFKENEPLLAAQYTKDVESRVFRA
ncbi:YqaJ viral recombinase family protein [Endozoicomonas sp. SM1973]|uniref:YqaJ viral recombinase family protein n=1 Tax=Spartinivicinus marinus TaxID=2994442 RepID=A0A853IIW5_9GAMM|nr:YqaJ viral recombinase family protein [Spartinivicinus marinus]NYZ69347.1 YqaJ viral recombinase family protein [Spartinivicinus marinus]